MELFERVEFFTGTCEGNGTTNDFFHRQRRTTASIAIELRQDDAVDLQGVMKCFSNVDGILTSHRINHQERVVRRDLIRDLANLRHHFVVN